MRGRPTTPLPCLLALPCCVFHGLHCQPRSCCSLPGHEGDFVVVWIPVGSLLLPPSLHPAAAAAAGAPSQLRPCGSRLRVGSCCCPDFLHHPLAGSGCGLGKARGLGNEACQPAGVVHKSGHQRPVGACAGAGKQGGVGCELPRPGNAAPAARQSGPTGSHCTPTTIRPAANRSDQV
jgi:hypothetical protein